MVHWEKTFTPRVDAAHIYRELYERVYKRIYRALEPLYHQIHRITGYPDI